jgi:hypothetical protein
MTNKIYFGDNLEILKGMSDKSVPLVYIVIWSSLSTVF